MIAEKPIEQITSADLEQLVTNGVGESRTLEYKEALPGGADQDKREFLADVSSFANAIGGDLVYGARERRDQEGKPTGTPEAIIGVDLGNLDQTIQRLENVLRDGLAPRVPGIRFWPVAGFERGPALIVRIPRSWAAPHMVTFQQSGKFFTRHSGGKHQLDVLEVRDAFLNTRSASERAEDFRTAQLGRLIGGGAPVPLSSEKLLCVHAVPHGALFGALAVDLKKATVHSGELRPMEASGWGPRFNIDGVFSVASAARSTHSTGYVQLFRNGVVEVVFSDVFFDPPPEMKTAVAGVGAGFVAKELIGLLERLQRLFRILDVPPPVSFFISLHGMKAVTFHVSQRLSSYGRHAFDRDTILLPEVSMDGYDSSPTKLLKPAMDALWQAAGLERCFDYADDGTWTPQS
jgi:hypothetical protein